jgi:hypothetical protein
MTAAGADQPLDETILPFGMNRDGKGSQRFEVYLWLIAGSEIKKTGPCLAIYQSNEALHPDHDRCTHHYQAPSKFEMFTA